MQSRTDPRELYHLAPRIEKALLALAASVRTSGLEASLVDLIRIRASQINDCAYCLHLHTRDARA